MVPKVSTKVHKSVHSAEDLAKVKHLWWGTWGQKISTYLKLKQKKTAWFFNTCDQFLSQLCTMSHITYWQISDCFWKTYSSVEEINSLCKYMGRK